MAETLEELMRPRKVCLCKGVSKEDLVRAIRGGAMTLSQLQKETLAGTGCGTCLVQVMEILQEEKFRLKAEKEGQGIFGGF